MMPVRLAPEALKDCAAEGLPPVALNEVSEPLTLIAGSGIS